MRENPFKPCPKGGLPVVAMRPQLRETVWGWTAEKSQIAEGRMARGREKMLQLHQRKCKFPLAVSEQTVDVSKEKNQLSSLAGSCVIIREWENQLSKKCSALFHCFLSQLLWLLEWISNCDQEDEGGRMEMKGRKENKFMLLSSAFLSSEAPRSRKGMCFNLKSCSNLWLLHGTTKI